MRHSLPESIAPRTTQGCHTASSRRPLLRGFQRENLVIMFCSDLPAHVK